jgi:hypothetical protein
VNIEGPAGSAVMVNGRPVEGVTAPVELALIPGLHRLSVKAGDSQRERVLNVRPGARLRWTVTP